MIIKMMIKQNSMKVDFCSSIKKSTMLKIIILNTESTTNLVGKLCLINVVNTAPSHGGGDVGGARTR